MRAFTIRNQLTFLALALVLGHCHGQQLQLKDSRLTEAGEFKLTFSGRTNAYYRVFRSPQLGDLVRPLDGPRAVVLGSTEMTIIDSAVAEGVGFYRVQEVPLDSPLDSDGDSIDDVWELRRPGLLHPLNRTDAIGDPDNDGRTLLQDYQLATAKPTTIRELSPYNEETGVSVNRETIVRFTQALATNTVLKTDQFFAGFGGRKLLTRVELSGDRKTATLFYLEPLPGGARINVVFDGTGLTDHLGRPLDVDGDGQPGGVYLLAFETHSTSQVPKTAVVGRVFASELLPGPGAGNNGLNRPLEGVTITVDGMEETMRAVTDAEGNFRLTNCPAGRFFVHIDGRTSPDSHWPGGAFYPVVGKAWEAAAGRQDNVAGDGPPNQRTGNIFLPRIPENTLRPVSASQDTIVTLPPSALTNNPALAGVSITVPANSLYADNGTRGGRVGVAAVPPDRLPGPLPQGMALPIVITVQTDGGQNFERPIPVQFPNLPDPATGRIAAPGSQAKLVSFDHDTGRWEIVGDMTVSNDGLFVISNTGHGIRKPGWHGFIDGVIDTVFPPPPAGCKRSSEFIECQLGCRGGGIVICYSTCKYFGLLGGIIPYFACQLSCGVAAGYACYEACEPHCGNSSARVGLHDTGSSSLLRIRDKHSARFLAVQSEAYPWVARGETLPFDLRIKAEALVQEVSTEAGMPIQEFISAIRAIEEEAVFENGAPATPLPDYPIHYMASVHVNGAVTLLRGQTGPRCEVLIRDPAGGRVEELYFYDHRNQSIAFAQRNIDPTRSPAFHPPMFGPLSSGMKDLDADGTPDIVEAILGRDPLNVDNDELPASGGIVASDASLDGVVDLAGLDGLLMTANGASGASIFNIMERMPPVRVGQIDTDGTANRVAANGKLAAIADGPAGLVLFDISDPTNPTVLHQRSLGDSQEAVSVALGGDIAYVGSGSGQLLAVSAWTGSVMARINLTNRIHDLFVAGTNLYALAGTGFHVLSLTNGIPRLVGSVASPGKHEIQGGDARLFAADGVAYAAHSRGYNTYDVSTPALPRLIAHTNQNQFGWKQIVLDGSGVGVAAVGLNSTSGREDDVWLLDTRDPRLTDSFLTLFETPGSARSIAIHQGMAYVADREEGLQVINYAAPDRQRVPPRITLTTDLGAAAPSVESDRLITAMAQAVDDVRVRGVEFYVDGVLIGVDGNYPFEYRFRAPPHRVGSTSFRLRAKATDTGGNTAWSDELLITLLPDATAPRIASAIPADGRIIGGGSTGSISAIFSEPVDPSSLSQVGIRLLAAGSDRVFDSADDVTMMGGQLIYQADVRRWSLSFGQPIPAGLYRAEVSRGIRDFAGNVMEAYNWTFRVVDADLSRGDGVDGGGFLDDYSRDDYRFTAVPGQTVFFQVESFDDAIGYMKWQLWDEAGSILFDARFVQGSPGRVILQRGGAYRVRVNTSGEYLGSGNYRIRIVPVPVPQVFPLVIGGAVSNGVPSVGAGVIESPGVVDVYAFDAASGQTVFFQVDRFDTAIRSMAWQLRDETGAVLFDRLLFQGHPGRLELERGGRYTLTVNTDGVRDGTGSYEFRILPVEAGQVFPLMIGQAVSNGVPSVGAGVIESPGAVDVFTFDASPGQTVFFQVDRFDTAIRSMTWQLRDEAGTQLFDRRLFQSHPGRFELLRGGRYTLTVNTDGYHDGAGSYAFQVLSVAVPQEFGIKIGDAVGKGVPAIGAGSIESPGSVDVYYFDATPGQVVFVQTDGFDAVIRTMTWELRDESGTLLFDRRWFQGDPGRWVLERGGRYTITVNPVGNHGGVGNYAFRLFPVEP